jgi:HEAT repeat protein
MWKAVFSVLTSPFTALDGFLQTPWRRKVWQEVAAAHGLRVGETSPSRESQPMLRAWAGPIEVRFEETLRNSTRLVVVVPGHPGFVGLTIYRKQARPSGAPGISIGDELFDRAFYVSGPLWLIHALFDAEARRLLLRANGWCRLEIAGGELRAEMPEAHLTNLLPYFLEIGRHLAQHLDIPRRLRENALRDPEAGVRLQSLRLLIRDHRMDPETAEVLRTACADASPEIRLRAAKELGAEGREILLELAESTLGDTLSAEAVSSLGRDLAIERARAILGRVLHSDHVQTARACLEALGGSTAAENIDTLAQVMAGEQCELAAAAALGSTGSPAAEPPLILALQEDPEELQVAAANALARVGTATAVLPLKEVVERISYYPEARKAARQAIAEIQSRLQGASPGQLSLAGTEAGQLSLAPAEAGQLSLATEPAGQLSLSDGEEG